MDKGGGFRSRLRKHLFRAGVDSGHQPELPIEQNPTHGFLGHTRLAIPDRVLKEIDLRAVLARANSMGFVPASRILRRR
jgi:hypothetical protein